MCSCWLNSLLYFFLFLSWLSWGCLYVCIKHLELVRHLFSVDYSVCVLGSACKIQDVFLCWFQLLLPAGPFRDFLGNRNPVSQWCVGSLAILCSSLCIYTASLLDRDECRAWVFGFFLFISKEHCLTVSQWYLVGFSVPSLAFSFPGSPCYISGWLKDVLLAQSRSATSG